MKFSLRILARDITSAIKLTSQVADNGNIPILKTTLIRVNSGVATFTATNTNQTIVIRAACEGDGETCIDTAALSDKISTLKQADPVSFDGDGKQVVVTQGRTKWKLPCLPAGDFPAQVADEIAAEPVEVTEDFVAAINAVSPVIGTVDGQPYSGVHLDGSRVVATNGKAMRVVEIGAEFNRSITLPARVLKLVPPSCDVRLDENAASFSTDTMTIKTKLVAGTYPDWRRIEASFSDQLTGEFNVSRDDFIASLERASAIKASGEKAGAFINMQLRIRDGELEVYTRNNVEAEEGSDFVTIERDGDDLDIGFNGAMVIDAVKSLACDTVKVRYGTPDKPIIMSPVASDRENMRFVMPRAFS